MSVINKIIIGLSVVCFIMFFYIISLKKDIKNYKEENNSLKNIVSTIKIQQDKLKLDFDLRIKEENLLNSKYKNINIELQKKLDFNNPSDKCINIEVSKKLIEVLNGN